ncbi:MAG: ABC transporter transmembrane domain-containing protein, partial [Cytophagales bacterium]|nr:ABC transporter transmembrane domain-containing protein [Cytophagales bacterium]
MKSYFRILSYTFPYKIGYLGYGLSILVYLATSMLNLAMALPLLDLLFGGASQEIIQNHSNPPTFEWNADHLKDLLYYHLYQTVLREGKLHTLRWVSLILLGSVIISSLSRYASEIFAAYIRFSAVGHLRSLFYKKILSLSLGFFSKKRKGDLLSRFSSDMQQLEQHLIDTNKTVFKDPLSILFYFFLLLFLSPYLTALSLLLVPILGLVIS